MRQLPESGYFWLALASAVLLVGVVLTVCFWDWLHPEDSTTVSNSETLRNVGLLVGGALAFVFAGWRAWLAEQEKATARRQAETAQQSLLNERYERGAEMLGSEVLAVRLGGIYALRHLAEEHPEQYHIRVMELFCAFVRTSVSSNGSPEVVRTAMAVIGSRSDSDVQLESNESFELNLSGADLWDAHLARLNLSGANLMNADLTGADLPNVDLSNARLQNANLKDAWLYEANLSGAQFSIGEGDYPAKGLTQAQINAGHAYRDNPPKLDGVLDAQSGEQLTPPTTEPGYWEELTKLVQESKQSQ